MSIFDFLLHPKPPVIPANASPNRDLALHALTIAEQFASGNTLEQSYNRSDQIDFFNKMAGVPLSSSWCAAFVYDCFAKAWMWKKGLLTGKTGHENRLIMLSEADAFSHATGFPRTGYCPTLLQAYVHSGMVVAGSDVKKFTPAPGDIALFDFLDQGEPHHVSIVVQPAGSSGEIVSCEGNTSSGVYGSQADGDGVFIRIRERRRVFAFIHWK